MERIRIGNDIELRWKIYTTDAEGVSSSYDLTGKSLEVSLFNAFSKYKEMYDASVRIESMATEIPAVSADTLKRSVLYAIQIFASGKTLPKDDSRFLGYIPLVIQGSSINRYFICSGENLAEVSEHLPKVKEKYPDSFLVQIIDGKEVRRVK